MSQDPVSSSESSHSEDDSKELKRKRVEQDDDLEIDLNLPEPPSKKALRQLKKAKTNEGKPAKPKAVIYDTDELPTTPVEEVKSNKSEWAIWIGNMLWTTTKDDLRDFLTKKGGLEREAITRIHMPPPPPKGPTWKGPKPINKGFAYVDFDTETSMHIAIALSETLLDGRKVLIKNAKSFEGRPDKAAEAVPEKEPNKKIFVGNLAFETTKDEVREHFSQAGEVEDVFLTTFQDSGKCKGYGWVMFKDLDSAKAAVAGFILKTETKTDEEVAEDKLKTKKPRKWFINRFQGRTLRCEYAEDAQTRYKKRFNKTSTEETDVVEQEQEDRAYTPRPSKRLDADERQALRRQKHEDARLVPPARALANAQRASAAIVNSSGTKTTFD